jgi:formylglycine-generating enzyme required for sulfatase activity
MQNELGTEVPPSVTKKAEQMGCLQSVKYVYLDGVYGSRFPAASIGSKKATRFGNIASANAHKVNLGSGWVAFKSPSYANVNIADEPSTKKIENNSLSNSTSTKKTNDIISSATPKSDLKSIPLSTQRETEFYQGYIRFKMSVANTTSSIIADVSLDFILDENLLHIVEHGDYPLKNGKLILGNIYGGKSKTITILFEPLTCAKATDIKCQVNYVDHEGNMASVFMEPKEISVVCPIMKTDQDINIGMLKGFIEKLPSKDSRVYEIQNGFNVKRLAIIAREVVEKHDVKHIRTLNTRDNRTCEIWYYGRTKVNQDDIVIKVSIVTEHQTMELFAATCSAEALTGLLAEVGRDLKQTIESKAGGRGRVVNLTINGSVIQRSNLLDMCNMDGTCDVNVVIEDSVVQHSSIGGAAEKARLRREQEEDQRKRLEEQLRQAHVQKPAFFPAEKPPLKENNKDNSTGIKKNSIGMEFVLIPPGKFNMGSNECKDEKPVHKVHIPNPYYLSRYPVTQREWKAVMNSNPSKFKSDDRPVECVSWNDAQDFIRKLNENEGTNKYRLPSESEWEYACRSGTTTVYSFGNDESKLNDFLWYTNNSGKRTQIVGLKKQNSWNLCDMHGNVWEWVQDRWHSSYVGAPTDSSEWDEGSNPNRIARGGSWNTLAKGCRAATRLYYRPGTKTDHLGFRVLREV